MTCLQIEGLGWKLQLLCGKTAASSGAYRWLRDIHERQWEMRQESCCQAYPDNSNQDYDLPVAFYIKTIKPCSIPQVIHFRTIKLLQEIKRRKKIKIYIRFVFNPSSPDVYNWGKTLQLREPQWENIAACVPLINKTQSSFIYCKLLTHRCLEVCMFHPLCLQLHTVSPWNELQQANERPIGEETQPHWSYIPINCPHYQQGGELFSCCPSLPSHLHTGTRSHFGSRSLVLLERCWSVGAARPPLLPTHLTENIPHLLVQAPPAHSYPKVMRSTGRKRPSPNKTHGTNRLLISHRLSVCCKQLLQISYWMCRPLKQTDISSTE